jgi:neutral amino acid transport system permease protein
VTLALAALMALVWGAAPAGAQTEEPVDDAPTTEQSVGGRLTAAGEPVAGVTFTVETDDGEPVGTAITDDDGRWTVDLPAPGRHRVTIDPETLPEGVALADPDRTTLTPNIRASANQSVVFSLDERTTDRASRVDRLSNLAAEGVKFGFMIALAALGLSMVFGVTGLVNFAHGELLAFGAILTWWLERGYGPAPEMPLVLAAVIAIVVTAGFASLWEIGIFGPVRRRQSGAIAAMVISIGLALVVRYIWLILAGSRPDFYLDFRLQSGFRIGPVSLTPKAWASVVISGAVLLAVGWALKNTRIGTAMRAVSVNKDLAESSGIDVKRVTIVTWLAGGALAGLSGVLFGIAESVRWNMGNDVLLLIFAAVVLGGLGTAYGAMLGGLVVGLVTQLSTYWFPTELKLMFALLVLVVILLFRPQGILGVRERFG